MSGKNNNANADEKSDTLRVGKKPTPEASVKIDRILAACEEPVELDALILLATSTEGLVNDEVRREAWPILLRYDCKTTVESTLSRAWRSLPPHKDEDQVRLDVDRSFVYYPKNENDRQLDRRKAELSAVITEVLRSYSMLSYFQGFHDIVQVFLLVLGVDGAAIATTHLSLQRIRDFMLPSLSASIAQLQLLPAILQAVDNELCKHLSQTQPFFALAATLTLYAHEIQEYGDIARLFDFLLAHGAVMSLYFFAVIVLSRRDELLEIPASEPEMLHSVLSKLPKPLDLETLISKTTSIFEQFPPERLPRRAWNKVSPYSVLKTTREITHQPSLSESMKLFEKQVTQLRKEQNRERYMKQIQQYRRPARNVGIAVLIGVFSFWLRRTGWDGYPAVWLRRLWQTTRLHGMNFRV
ncbi:MAG: hypothetical protein Q9167_000157 [Letrouitia subvulpina]